MKSTLTIFLFLLGVTSYSQNNKYVGDYFQKLGNDKHIIEYTLKLNGDGTFIFHSYSNNEKGIPNITHSYGRGNWISKKGLLTFYLDEKDMNEKYTLDFSGTKARYIPKSPRDTSDREIKTRLKFYESGIFWMKGIELLKLDN